MDGMCGRFAIVSPAEKLFEYFGTEVGMDLDLRARYNIAPGQTVPVLPNKSPRGFELFRWGLFPPWAQDGAEGGGGGLINARSESAHEKASFKKPMRRQRCIVPADGFYEWTPAGTGKQPVLIRRRDEKPMALAGLWETWLEGDRKQERDRDRPLSTFTILTCAPNALLAPIHDRMPVILAPEHWDRWLAPEPLEPADVRDLLVPCPEDGLTLREVNPALNSVRNEGPKLWQVPQQSLFRE